MTPTYEQYKRGSTQWRSNVQGIGVLLSHHGVTEEPSPFTGKAHPGTWCYYLLVSEQTYPDEWDDFASTRDGNGYMHNGPAFDDIEFHGGITFADSVPYYDRKTKREWDGAKVGCDYNHLWDEEEGYWRGFEDVLRDAEASARQLLEERPNYHLRCAYSGVWGPKDQFYTAKNGATCHLDVLQRDDVSEYWQRAA